jgi:phosphohistidine phosphatase
MCVAAELPDWPEAAFRRRKWTTVKKAEKRVDEEALRAIIRRLPEAIERSAAGSGRHRLAAESGPVRVIYLLRHAKSSWSDPTLDDADRPLAGRGRRAAKAMRRYMKIADVRPDLVLCSPAERARETLQSVLSALGGPAIRFEAELYLVGQGALMDCLRRVPDEAASVMVIGHNPGFHDLARSMSRDGDPDALARLEAKFPTGGLATLVLQRDHWKDLEPGACELHSFVVPRQLE